jgi:hypothetical protein
MNAVCKDQRFRRARVRGRAMSEFALSSHFAGRSIRMLRIVEPLRRLVQALSDHYHPELHYMRGPGPKWREKHAPPAQQQAPDSASPDLQGLYDAR